MSIGKISAAVLALAGPVAAFGQTADFSQGTLGNLGVTSVTDSTTGVAATGWSSTTQGGTYTQAQLYRRAESGDNGLGVCSEADACSSDGDVNEISNGTNWEIISLTRPASKEWVSVQLSSMDGNGGGEPEHGRLYAASSITGAWTLIQDFTGNDAAREPTFVIPTAYKQANYLIFQANDTVDPTNRNNDFLVWKATVVTPALTCQGTGTQGYWKNHPQAWPAPTITVGGKTYTVAQAIAIMNIAVAGDKTYSLFDQLVAGMLNGQIGCSCGTIPDTITAANTWLALNPVGSGVKASSAAWAVGGPLATTLDNYNNGLLCAPHRD